MRKKSLKNWNKFFYEVTLLQRAVTTLIFVPIVLFDVQEGVGEVVLKHHLFNEKRNFKKQIYDSLYNNDED